MAHIHQWKYFRTLIGILSVVLVIVACEQQQEETVLEPLDAEGISGDRLWERITEETDFENYDSWPEHEGMRPGQAPHGQFHRIYVNQPLLSQVPIESRTAPYGSIIVKENYNPAQELTGYTVMAKVDGFNSEAGDWFWASYGTDGTIRAQGAVDSCISCHAGMESNDYIIVYPLDRPLEGSDSSE